MKNTHGCRLRRITVIAALVLLLGGGPALAEMPDDESDDARIGTVPSGDDRRALERVEEKLQRLERQRERLDALRRTRHPFHSERKLRHQMRRNEADQRWLKEQRNRIEHEQRRMQKRAQ